MAQFQGNRDFDHSTAACTGILITNLGTPQAPTAAGVRRYLAEFLSDPRVVETPRWLWQLILHGIILRIRPGRVAKAYQSVWTERGSPLLAISQQLVAKLQTEATQVFPGPVRIELAMRYGQPSIEAGLQALRKANARRILVFPLYPQYSATTTATTFDAVSKVLQRWRWLPELRMINHYHDHPAYIQALSDSIRAHWQRHGRMERLLMSFHGLPKRYLLEGDPYFCECHKTARLVAENLRLEDKQWQLSFQSRFGREEWLKPYTDKTLEEWGQQGVKSIQVISPGFSVDCLETLEEMDIQNRELFVEAGGQEYQYIPALNAEPGHISMLLDLIRQHSAGWPETDASLTREGASALQQRQQRALALALGAEK